MITPNDLQLALHDLARTIPLSGVNDDGQIYAYEYNGTARVIVLAINALAKIREAEVNTNTEDSESKVKATNGDRIRAMSDEELAEKLTWIVPYCGDCPARKEECSQDCTNAWLDWLKKEVDG